MPRIPRVLHPAYVRDRRVVFAGRDERTGLRCGAFVPSPRLVRAREMTAEGLTANPAAGDVRDVCGHLLPTPRYPTALRAETEQFCRGAAEDVDLVFVAERCRGENMVHRLQLPRIGIVAAEHDLTGADLGHQMADGLG